MTSCFDFRDPGRRSPAPDPFRSMLHRLRPKKGDTRLRSRRGSNRLAAIRYRAGFALHPINAGYAGGLRAPLPGAARPPRRRARGPA